MRAIPNARRLILLLIALLYGPLAGDAIAQGPGAAAPPAATTSPVPPPAPPPAEKPLGTAEKPGASVPPPAAEGPRPHIALLLPLNSPSFGRHADSLRQGFELASRTTPGSLPVIAYPVGEDATEIVPAYRRAIEAGARAVAGPLTRSGVSTLAASGELPVPTLALNTPDTDVRPPKRMYLFGLAVEAEARQIAQLVFQSGRRNAITISDETPLSRRIRQAFLAEWAQTGGSHQADFLYTTSPTAVAALRQAAQAPEVDVVFLAIDAAKARLVRPNLPPGKAIFATSQVQPSRPEPIAHFDLAGIRFVDMPWILQSDHPAVMIYARGESIAPGSDYDRLYALGIDAFRLLQDMLGGMSVASAPLDGVTGRITLGPGQQFQRELVPAQFVDGKAVPERP